MEGHVGVPRSKSQLGEEGRIHLRIRLDPLGDGYLARAAQFPCAR